MKSALAVVLTTFSVASCAASPPATGSGATTPAPAPVIETVEHTGASPISHVLTPDAHAVSILFDKLQASADSHKIGGAQLGDILAISIKGSGVARVTINARGSIDANEGDCEVSLSTPTGGAGHWAAGGGAYGLDLYVDVPLPFVLKLAVGGLCWSKPVEGGFALLTVESLEVTTEQRPDDGPAKKTR